MRVITRNNDRSFDEMYEMWWWLTRTFGPPSSHDLNRRWIYGKEPDMFGHTLTNGPFDIEWLEFVDERDAEFFLLRWS